MASYSEIDQEFATQQMDHEASNIQTSIKRASRNLRTTRVGAETSRLDERVRCSNDVNSLTRRGTKTRARQKAERISDHIIRFRLK